MRVDVDAQRDAPQLTLRCDPLNRLAHCVHGLGALFRLQQQASPFAPAEPKDGGWPEHFGTGWDRLAQQARDAGGRPVERLLPLRGEIDRDQVRERRIAQSAAALQLAGQKAGGVVARRKEMLGAAGASVCTITRPPPGPRPLRPASWVTIAKVRSSARKSGKRRVASASRMTLSVTSGKSWPLPTIWVPTSTPRGRLLEAAEDLGVGATTGGGVGVEAECGQRIEALGEQLLDTLGAGAGASQGYRATLGTSPRRRLGVTAVVAGESPGRPVRDQRDVAIRAAPVMAAGAAADIGRKAAPVDQHDRLAPFPAHLLQRIEGRGPSGPPRGSAPRMSTISTGGSPCPSTRLGSSSRGSASQVSGRGVAVPASSTAPASALRRRATRRAS